MSISFVSGQTAAIARNSIPQGAQLTQVNELWKGKAKQQVELWGQKLIVS